MRIFLLVVGWMAVAASLRPALAQQLVCQQQQGQIIPQQGVNLMYRGGLTAVSPDSALLFRVTLPNGSYNVTTTTPTGLVWVRRGSCDTARFASLAATKLTPSGSLAGQTTFIVPTRRRQVRVLHTVFTDSLRVRLYAYTRQGQLRWARTYASHGVSELAQGLSEAPDGGMYISTISGGAAPIPITSLLKVDSLGRVKWQRTYASNRGGNGAATGRAFGFFRPVYTVRGNLLLAGTWTVDSVGVNSYGLMLETNQKGDSLTSRKFPTRKLARVGVLVTGVRVLRNGGFLITTRIDTPTTTTTRIYCGFTRLDANLQEQWTYIYRPTNSFRFSPPELSQGLELADGSLLGAVYINKFNAYSVRLLHLSATGQLLQEYTVPSTTLTFGALSLAPLEADSSFVLGGADAATGLASVLQVRIPGLRRVLAEPPIPAAQDVLATHAKAVSLPLTAYPNPAGTTLHVPYTIPPGAGAGQLLAYDALGRVVQRQALPARQGEAEVNVQSWPAGLYQLTLVLDGQVQRQQRIVVTH
jgi:hypothetical protein